MNMQIRFLEKVPPFFRNKYILTLIVFLVWIILFDSNNLITRFSDMRELHKLRNDKEYYKEKVKADRQKLYELKTDSRNLEKFAREQYHMKKPDEDLYIILTPAEDRKITRKNN